MSTDTYFDFHSPEGWELNLQSFRSTENGLTSEQAWAGFQKWCEFEKSERDKGYDEKGCKKGLGQCVHRVGYIYNLTCDSNIDAYHSFYEKWSSRVVEAEKIPEMVTEWQAMYDAAMTDELTDFCRDDFADGGSIKRDLESHIGRVLYIRVD